MSSKIIMGSGAILAAVLIALTELLNWPGYLQYVWALLIAIWAIVIFAKGA